ncbi:response regulator [Pararhodospirillum oryzae]|uniref:Response regulator n=1 Tax=Pararhodospirillum oryzae TaxID=478448 RepID=A0A512H7A0_9PROT|nr:response regulator [Pararhodospirillum oryzae]GEO81332.1 response regulator [Pararhodospirillum oryzae]
MNILVVDDVEVVRLVIGKILKKAGHVTFMADGADQALKIAQSTPIDVLVTDIWMPETDGFALLRAFRTRFPRVGRIAVSGGSPVSSLDDSLATAREAGAAVVIMKPVDRDELLEALEQAAPKNPALGPS